MSLCSCTTHVLPVLSVRKRLCILYVPPKFHSLLSRGNILKLYTHPRIGCKQLMCNNKNSQNRDQTYDKNQSLSGTMCDTLFYCNSGLVSSRLRNVYSVISVEIERLKLRQSIGSSSTRVQFLHSWADLSANFAASLLRLSANLADRRSGSKSSLTFRHLWPSFFDFFLSKFFGLKAPT